MDLAVAVDFGNYLETSNPFGLARPPAHFLAALHRFDADAVLFPSMQEPIYVFARRRRFCPGINRLLGHKPDLTFCQQHKLLGVTGILPGPHWSPQLLEDLAKVDSYRTRRVEVGGQGEAGNAMADALDRLEAEKQLALDRQLVDECDARSASAYFGLGLRQGSTTFVQGYSAPS